MLATKCCSGLPGIPLEIPYIYEPTTITVHDNYHGVDIILQSTWVRPQAVVKDYYGKHVALCMDLSARCSLCLL